MEKNNKTAVIIAAIVAIAVIGGGIILAMNKKDDSNVASTSQTPASEQTTMEKTATQQPKQNDANIVDLAVATPSLSTLVTAVKAASLVETLQGTGPYTVFAPTNNAFDALPSGTVDTLLKPENVETLKSVLTYHVVAGKVMSSDLKDGQVITTVQGASLTVKITDGKVYLIDAKGNQVMVEKADIEASNGVVHVIDGVLLAS